MKNNGTGNNNENALIHEKAELRWRLEEIIKATPVIDIHTHLFSPEFGALNLYGIDEILTYHYLVAELFRSHSIAPDDFWKLAKSQQADLIWRTLFVENTPLSEAACGVVTILSALGLDTRAENLSGAREFFRTQGVGEHLDRVLEHAGVSDVVMTNDPFDAEEIETWTSGEKIDPRFHAALRMDRLLNGWEQAADKLLKAGYEVEKSVNNKTVSEIRRFLDGWISVMKPLYMAVSLPDDFLYPADDARTRIIDEIVLPTARAHDLPFALMIGVRRGVNPALRVAGDGVGFAEMRALEKLCAENSDVRFFATFLSRENQHELCVAARKFSNLMPFGCWWFLNNPSIIAEITDERLELLGTSFIPQHSDARVLEQLIYKWKHSRRVITESLYKSYERLLIAGRAVTPTEIRRDVERMFSGSFSRWVNLPAAAKEAGEAEYYSG